MAVLTSSISRFWVRVLPFVQQHSPFPPSIPSSSNELPMLSHLHLVAMPELCFKRGSWVTNSTWASIPMNPSWRIRDLLL
jgi:hypothetical protein